MVRRRCGGQRPLEQRYWRSGEADLKRNTDAHHLGYSRRVILPAAGRATNRNGTSAKTVLTEDGSVEIDVPRDRNGSFEPQIVPKGETRLDGFDDKIISLYARGMTVREIQGHLRELYAVEVSPDLISRVTDAVLDEVREWQTRPLDAVYPVVFFDALRVKIRDGAWSRTRPCTCPGARLRGPQARPGPVDRAERGRQVLAARHDRAEEPRCR